MPVSDFTFRSFDLDQFPVAGQVAQLTDLPLFPASSSIRSPWPHLVQALRLLKQGYAYVYERGFTYNPTIVNKRSTRIYLNGYWQSYRYFEEIETILRADLAFNTPLPAAASALSAQILTTNSVCLHIRRTDFLHVPLHQIPDSDYVNQAVGFIHQQVNDPYFFVFSDDISWCKANLVVPFPLVFVPSELAGDKNMLHFRLMSYCKHFITANSTFSWWAAWLSQQEPQKIVVTPKKWFSDSRSIEDLIPTTWVRL